MRKRKRHRLFLRRVIVVLCILVIISAFLTGTIVLVRGAHRIIKSSLSSTSASILQENSQPPKSPPMSSSGNGETASTAASSASPAKPLSYFDDAAFIGDSRTEGLENYNGLGNAEYYAVKGLMVNTVYTKPAITSGSRKVSVMQAIQAHKFGKVYIMLGVNELGWSSSQNFADDYGKLIDDIRKCQNNTKIYVQSILPVTAKKSASDKVYNNDKIASYNKMIEKLASDKKVNYLAVNTAVWDSKGNLPESASVDGVHLKQEYCKKWCEYLNTHR